MKTLAYLSGALIVAASFAGGAWWNHHPVTLAAQAQKIVAYSCPMHPHYRSDRPGDCALCGMRLEPVDADDKRDPGHADSQPLPTGAVKVSPEQQQTIGVRFGVTERISGTRTLRTTGRVAADENATYAVVAGQDGWIRDAKYATTGSQVKKNEVLTSFYSPDFLVAQQSYYSGLDSFDRTVGQAGQVQGFKQDRVVDGVQRFASTLRSFGISEQQLEHMRNKRELVQDLDVVSPVDGVVLQRNVSAGLRFGRGFEFFRIADLSNVWILADVYENQRPYIKRGTIANITTSQERRHLPATVSGAEPLFDEATRTLKARLEAANPGFALKPGMFVDVEFSIQLSDILAVPADAIVDSGLHKTVFVDRGNGYFEPRLVETGVRIGDLIEVTSGLMPGERIVISGTFLIDSESRMKAPTTRAASTTAKDPVCGMNVDTQQATAAGHTARHHAGTQYFCSDDCQKRFAAMPDESAKR